MDHTNPHTSLNAILDEPLKGIRGTILTFKSDPFLNDASQCYDLFSDGLIVIQNGKILQVGNYRDVAQLYPALTDKSSETQKQTLRRCCRAPQKGKWSE